MHELQKSLISLQFSIKSGHGQWKDATHRPRRDKDAEASSCQILLSQNAIIAGNRCRFNGSRLIIREKVYAFLQAFFNSSTTIFSALIRAYRLSLDSRIYQGA